MMQACHNRLSRDEVDGLYFVPCAGYAVRIKPRRRALISERPAYDYADDVIRELMFIAQMPPDARFHEPPLAILQIGEGGSRWQDYLTAWTLQAQHAGTLEGFSAVSQFSQQLCFKFRCGVAFHPVTIQSGAVRVEESGLLQVAATPDRLDWAINRP
jgi:hypothetical protein